MQLLIDAGNTRIKFARLSGETITLLFHCNHDEDIQRAFNTSAQDNASENFHEIWLCSTLGKQLTGILLKKLKHVWPKTPIHLLSTDTQSTIVKHCYDEPDKLGIDRWLGLIAVQTQYKTPALIIDVGTVITIDLLQDQQHLGGWLCPGMNRMRSSLRTTPNIAAGIESNTLQATGNPQSKFGNSTTSCIELGCHSAIFAFIDYAIVQAKQVLANPYYIYITGGDAEEFANILSMSTTHVSNLVFEGMAYMTNHKLSKMETV